MSKQVIPHLSVLLREVLEVFRPCFLKQFVDGTLGAGGHAVHLLESHPEMELYLGIDQDPSALAIANQRLAPYKEKVILQQGNFADFTLFLQNLSIRQVNGILLDLGVSSMQFDQAERGFSFAKEGPLDMRMNPESSLTAAEIVNTWSERDLGAIFRNYGEEKKWRAAAQAIVTARVHHPFTTTYDLVHVLEPVLSQPFKSKKGIHPLTLIFQALRIAVNRELDVLEQVIPKAIAILAPGGRLAIISFHSLEDRIVKNQMRFAASDKWETSGLGGGLFRDKIPQVTLVTKKPITPSEEEIKRNPRSRSAKLRVVEKIVV